MDSSSHPGLHEACSQTQGAAPCLPQDKAQFPPAQPSHIAPVPKLRLSFPHSAQPHWARFCQAEAYSLPQGPVPTEARSMGQGPAAPRPNSHPRLYRACSQAHSPAPRPPEAQQSPPGSQHKAPFPQQRSAAPGPVLTGRGLPPPTGPGPPHGPHRARLPAGLSFPQGRTGPLSPPGPVSPPGPASRLPQHKARPSPVPPARPSSAPRPPQARPAHPELASLRLPRLRLRLRRLFPSLPDRSRSLSRSLRSRLRDPDPISRPPGAAPALRPRCARLGAGGRRGRGRAYTPAGCFRLFFFSPSFFSPTPPPSPFFFFLSFFFFFLCFSPQRRRGAGRKAPTPRCVCSTSRTLYHRAEDTSRRRTDLRKEKRRKKREKKKQKKRKQNKNKTVFPKEGNNSSNNSNEQPQTTNEEMK